MQVRAFERYIPLTSCLKFPDKALHANGFTFLLQIGFF